MMTQIPTFSAKQIAKFIEGVIEGDPNATVECFGQIDQCPEKGLTFLTDQKYAGCLYNTKASIAIVSQDFEPEEPVSCTLIRVKNPKKTFVSLLQFYDDLKPKRLGISSKAIINKSAVIGQGVSSSDFVILISSLRISFQSCLQFFSFLPQPFPFQPFPALREPVCIQRCRPKEEDVPSRSNCSDRPLA